jgi:hypothetical protein
VLLHSCTVIILPLFQSFQVEIMEWARVDGGVISVMIYGLLESIFYKQKL